jgi:hypothetical protein
MTVITPESGGPAAPGLKSTAQPIETGGPGMVVVLFLKTG